MDHEGSSRVDQWFSDQVQEYKRSSKKVNTVHDAKLPFFYPKVKADIFFEEGIRTNETQKTAIREQAGDEYKAPLG